MNLGWALTLALAKRAGRTLMVDDMRSYRGVELLVAGMHIASLVESGSSSARVGMLIPTTGAFGAVLHGVLMAGRTAVPLNYLLEHETLEYCVKDSGCDLVIASRRLVEHLGCEPRGARVVYLEDLDFKRMPVPRWPAMVGRDETAVVLYTSGTSGRPKGVMLTHGNLLSNVRQVERHVGLIKGDTFLGVLPQFHSFGITALTLAPMLLGCRVVYTARFNAKKLTELIVSHGATIYIGIPSMYGAILSSKSASASEFSSVRLAISGGEPLPADIRERFLDRFGVPICEGYGLTETSPVTNVLLPHEGRAGTVGRAVPGVRFRVVEPETGRELGVDEEGELRIAGPNVMKGYLNLPEETASVFDDRGFFRTGDIGRVDTEGFVSITGRLKEMLIVGGENVFPREIEEVLNAHPAVHASGVVGRHDPVRGEVPVAFVECEEGERVGGDELVRWCRERLAGYKVPKHVEVVDALPRNPTGKVLRRELKVRLAEAGLA